MGTPLDYQTGSTALATYMKTAIDSMVAAGQIPRFAEGMAEGFVANMAAGGAKAVIDAVDAERAKGA
jgi:hypothetical protein